MAKRKKHNVEKDKNTKSMHHLYDAAKSENAKMKYKRNSVKLSNTRIPHNAYYGSNCPKVMKGIKKKKEKNKPLQKIIMNSKFQPEDYTEGEQDIRKLVIQQNKKKKSGGFQSFGLSLPVLKGILRKGYKVPTPIQRKTIPVALEGKDVVAMARTGSGKTAAFLVPLFEKLKCNSAKSGARALILSPTRELALQTMKFTKEIGKFTGLKAITVLGGDNIENQFTSMHNNPDIILATPGRFLHLVVEMDLKLSSVEYVVFDEADRLFEMGFQEQLKEILNRLPDHRQTLLISATLPRFLVDFARAGLNDPVLIRLDLESKLSDQLKTAYFFCRSDDKPAILLHILKNVVKPKELTVVFVATRHHIEYLNDILVKADIPCSYVYSNLDQEARKINVAKIHSRKVNVLLVTDVAARGIDIPLLDNVINYTFPAKAKLFVHRVGRVARAGRSGTAYSLVASDEAAFLLDLHLFLDRPLKIAGHKIDNDDGVCGCIPQTIIDEESDFLRLWHDNSIDLRNMVKVCDNANKQYVKCRPTPSSESVKRMKELSNSLPGLHPLFQDKTHLEDERLKMLEGMKNYRPSTTIFEIGAKAKKEANDVMKTKRKLHNEVIERIKSCKMVKDLNEENIDENKSVNVEHMLAPDIDEIQKSFSVIIGGKGILNTNAEKKKKVHFKDEENFLHYKAADHHSEKGLELEKTFQQQAAGAVLDLIDDEERQMKQKKHNMKWDRKKKKFIRDGENEPKKIKTESGVWIPASYKTNLYKRWKEKNKITHHETNAANSDEENSGQFGKIRPGMKRKLYQKNRNQKGRAKPKRELKTKDEILKARRRKDRLYFHQKQRQKERSKRFHGQQKRR